MVCALVYSGSQPLVYGSGDPQDGQNWLIWLYNTGIKKLHNLVV